MGKPIREHAEGEIAYIAGRRPLLYDFYLVPAEVYTHKIIEELVAEGRVALKPKEHRLLV